MYFLRLSSYYNSLLNLKNDFKELDKFDSFEISQIFEIAANRYISNKKARIPNPDDCFRLCQEQFNSSVSHSWSQFLAYSAGCMIASPGIWTYFACQGIAAYVYDNQFDGHLDSFGICAKNCGF